MSEPNFHHRDFLTGHIRQILAFYHPRCLAPNGRGFYQHFLDDGTVYDTDSRHLVSSCRFIFNYAMATIHAETLSVDRAEQLTAVRHGIDYLRLHHRNSETGGYAWLLSHPADALGATVIDSTNHCYGLAFVLLAYSVAVKAGIEDAGEFLDETFALMEQHFWSEDDGLYRDEISGDWKIPSDYRGQNANMHSCEALIYAYEATGKASFLNRALTLARNICQRQASLADGLLWEHYDKHWQIDWDYNRQNPKHLFRPWGYQPGHFTEWAKLLLILERHHSEPWMLPQAQALFDIALERAWDTEYGGICYGFSTNGSICDSDKYFWVQAESLAAAALLSARTDDPIYAQRYQQIWQYAWSHLVDHVHGGWYRILDRQNNRYDNRKSPAGKTDYHTMGACYEVLRQIDLTVNMNPPG